MVNIHSVQGKREISICFFSNIKFSLLMLKKLISKEKFSTHIRRSDESQNLVNKQNRKRKTLLGYKRYIECM